MLKRILLLLIFAGVSLCSYAQKHLLNYDDFKFLLQNNIQHADTFLVAKGYSVVNPKNKNLRKRNYSFTNTNGNVTDIEIVIDGRKVTMTMQTLELLQYDVIKDSITQFGYTVNSLGDGQAYHVKDLGDIFVIIKEVEPYSPIYKDYTIALRGEKDIVILN